MNLTPQQAALAWAMGRKVEVLGTKGWITVLAIGERPGSDSTVDGSVFNFPITFSAFRLAPGETMNLTPQEAALAWASGKKIEAREVTDDVFMSVAPVGSSDGDWSPRVFGGTSGNYEFRLAPGETMEPKPAEDGEELDGIALQAMRLIYDKRTWNEPRDPASIAREAYDLAAAMIEESKRRKQ